jgi:hypothetical protein
MRVKFGNHIDLCKRVTHSEGSNILLITTVYNSLYTVDCTDEAIATELHNKVLVDGYIDVSNFYYSN